MPARAPVSRRRADPRSSERGSALVEVATLSVAALSALFSAIAAMATAYQAKVSVDQAEIARQQMLGSLRPYISFDLIDDGVSGLIKRTAYSGLFRNDGNTPAKLDYQVVWALQEVDKILEPKEEDFLRYSALPPHVVGKTLHAEVPVYLLRHPLSRTPGMRLRMYVFYREESGFGPAPIQRLCYDHAYDATLRDFQFRGMCRVR